MADQSPTNAPALNEDLQDLAARAVSQPLVTHIYTADPSAHVFDGNHDALQSEVARAGAMQSMPIVTVNL